jgi:hypothetical protein
VSAQPPTSNPTGSYTRATANETPETVASPDDDINNGGDPTWSQPPSPVLDAQPLYQPPDHDGHGLTSDNSPCTTPFEYHEHGSGMRLFVTECSIQSIGQTGENGEI